MIVQARQTTPARPAGGSESFNQNPILIVHVKLQPMDLNHESLGHPQAIDLAFFYLEFYYPNGN